jgi:glycosyltransferase involved in cell wall biosynthesis
MQEPLVSVIIPTFNRGYCLANAIQGLGDQTHSNWEAIIVDDGSTDDTRGMIERRYGDERRLRYIWQQNAGVSAARNKGLSLARGQYITFLDSDDVWLPWKLEAQLACFRVFPGIVMSWTDMSAVDATGSIISESYLRTMYTAYRWFKTEQLFPSSVDLREVSSSLATLYPGKRAYTGDIFSQMMMGNLVHTSTVLLPAQAVEKVGKFREEWRSGEDFQFHARVCRLGPVAYVDVPAVRYQVDMPDQLTRSQHQTELAENFLLTIRELIDKERAHIILSPRMLKKSLSEAHRWVGEEMLLGGDLHGGREHLTTSLRYGLSWRALALLAIQALPEAVRNGLRHAYRRLRPA